MDDSNQQDSAIDTRRQEISVGNISSALSAAIHSSTPTTRAFVTDNVLSIHDEERPLEGEVDALSGGSLPGRLARPHSCDYPASNVSPLLNATENSTDSDQKPSESLSLPIAALSSSLSVHSTFSDAVDGYRRQTSIQSLLTASQPRNAKEQRNHSEFNISGRKTKSIHSRSLSFNSDEYDDDDDGEVRLKDMFALGNLPLTPFKNQVGGHAAFLRFSDKALCKPLDPREQGFYETIESHHPALKPFIASYLGIVNVTFQQANDNAPNKEWFQDTAPVIMLERNRHLFEACDDAALSDSQNGSVDSNQGFTSFNKKLQQQVLKEALSPRSIRARVANMKVSPGNTTQRRRTYSQSPSQSSIQRNGSTSTLPDSVPEEDESAPRVALPRRKVSQRNTLPEDPDILPMFTMSDEEEEAELGVEEDSPHRTQSTRTYRPRRRNMAQKSESPAPHSTETFNPWSMHLYNTKLSQFSSPDSKTGSQAANENTHKFMLLEDLTEGMRFPCVLDLKMGTRQHGVNATHEKKLSQERKCERSTSKKLGVRICGMQVFKQTTRSYIYLDKYVGRQINAGNFKQNILAFIDNGESFLIGFIPRILVKLRHLYTVISSMRTYRFYASSLLILYDGEAFVDSSAPKREADIRMIDFANSVANIDLMRQRASTTDSPIPSSNPLSPELILSASSANTPLSQIVNIESATTTSSGPIDLTPRQTEMTITTKDLQPIIAATAFGSDNTTNTSTKLANPLEITPQSTSNNDVSQSTAAKLSTTDSTVIPVNYPPTTKGPDNGYLLGLQTLMSNFEDIYRELSDDPSIIDANGHVCKQFVPKAKRMALEIGSL